MPEVPLPIATEIYWISLTNWYGGLLGVHLWLLLRLCLVIEVYPS